MSRGLCAHAITRAHPTDLHDVMLIEHDGLALVVAEVDLTLFAEPDEESAQRPEEPDEDDPLVALAHQHDVAVDAVFEHNPVLPLRFGTVLRDEAAAVRLLTDHHDEASASLDRVEGHREWVVRARLPRPEKPAGTPTEGMSGTEYLAIRRDRLAAAARTRRDGTTAAAALHDALSRHAKENLHRDTSTPLLDAAYLVPVEAEQSFLAEAGRHDELAVDVTGPWPPYSFVRLELDNGAVAHA
jgi:hypothetical protein